MKPVADLQSGGGALIAVAKRLRPELAPQTTRVSGAIALAIAAAVLELARPWPLQWIVDRALIPAAAAESDASAWNTVFLAAGALALLSCLRAAALYAAALLQADAVRDLTRALRGRLFAHLLRLPSSFHAKQRTGDLIVRLQGDVGLVASTMLEGGVDLVARVFLLAGTLAMLFWIDPLLAAATLATAPLALAIASALSRKIHAAVRRARRKEGEFADWSFEALTHVTLVQGLGRVDHILRTFLRSSRSSARADAKAARLAARLAASIELLASFALAIALALGGARVLSGHLSAGDLLAFVAYVRSAARPLRQSSRAGARLAKGAACGERILDVLDQPLPREDDGLAPASAQPKLVALRGVDARYTDDAEDGLALKGFDVEFQRGSSTLIFGASGAGKSTLVALLTRSLEPVRGRVEWDGSNLRECSLGSLRSAIAVCPQETGLFGMSVRENLLLAKPDADEAQLWRALADADAEGFVRELPDGLDTELGSLGSGLSGGQRRRLTLARTLLREASVIVLDEPFNGLDSANVERLHGTLAARARDGIVIVIAHDVRAGERFDRVVFVERGHVRDVGSHAELMSRCDPYRLACSPRELEPWTS